MEVPVQQIAAVQHPSSGANGSVGALRSSQQLATIQARAATAATQPTYIGVYQAIYRVVREIMEPILQRLRQGSTLGPLSVLGILLVYSLLSPHLPEVFRQYVHQILH
jgi:hypothetical protein